MRLVSPALSVLIALTATAANAAQDQSSVQNLQLPESVYEDVGSGLIFASNIGGGPAKAETVVAKDGDGFISLLNADGTVLTERFLPRDGAPTLNGPKGMAMLGRILWVADIDRVVGFDVQQRQQIAEIDLSDQHVTFANDLLAVGGHLLCSDTVGGRVLSIDPGQDPGRDRVAIAVRAAVPGANGLAIAPDGRLVVAQTMFDGSAGRVMAVAADADAGIALPFPEGMWDGVAVGADGAVYAGDWTSHAVWVLPAGATQAKKLAGDIQGPADFCLLHDGASLLIPDMPGAKIKRVAIR